MPKMAFNVLLELYHELFKSKRPSGVQKYGEKTQKKGSIFRIEPVLLYLYMFNICLGPRETCINKGVERSYKQHFVASLTTFCRTH